MALFEFELTRVEDISPWGELGKQRLSWFALTDGRFRIEVGEQELFRYTDEIMLHWGMSKRNAEYEMIAFAQDMLGCVAAAITPLPPRIERLASNWPLLMELKKPFDDDHELDDLWYEAWLWLADRSPWTSYLTEFPRFQLVRVGSELRIHWDNREQTIDGIPVWTAQQGVYVMSVEAFLEESRDFARHLLSAMQDRIDGIEAGTMKPQSEVSTSSLREQHEKWSAEFASYFGEYQPSVLWERAEQALQTIAQEKGLHF